MKKMKLLSENMHNFYCKLSQQKMAENYWIPKLCKTKGEKE